MKTSIIILLSALLLGCASTSDSYNPDGDTIWERNPEAWWAQPALILDGLMQTAPGG